MDNKPLLITLLIIIIAALGITGFTVVSSFNTTKKLTDSVNNIQNKQSEMEGKLGEIASKVEDQKIEDGKSLLEELGIEQLRQNGIIDKNDHVVDIVFSKGINAYPKMITIRDENIDGEILIKSIKFLDEAGKIKKEVEVKRYIPDKQSPSVVGVVKGKKFVYVNDVIKEEKGEVEEAEASIFDLDGNLLRKIKNPYRDLYISPDGTYIIGTNSEFNEAPLGIYNQNGLVKEIEKGFRGFDADFSSNGDCFVITFGIRIEGKDGARADLMVVDKNGNELWRKEDLARGDAAYSCPVKILDDNSITLITGVGGYKIYHFSKEGNLISEEQGDLEQLNKFKKDI